MLNQRAQLVLDCKQRKEAKAIKISNIAHYKEGKGKCLTLEDHHSLQ